MGTPAMAKPDALSPRDARAQPASAAPVAPAPMSGADPALVDEAISDWQDMLAPMVDPIQRALDEAIASGETAEDFGAGGLGDGHGLVFHEIRGLFVNS